jgi:hypothetical protein
MEKRVGIYLRGLIGQMSIVAQKRHFGRTPLTSGLPRLADILRVIRHVSKVP